MDLKAWLILGLVAGWGLSLGYSYLHGEKHEDVVCVQQAQTAVTKRTDEEAKADHDTIAQLIKDKADLQHRLDTRPVPPSSVRNAARGCDAGLQASAGAGTAVVPEGSGAGLRDGDSPAPAYRLDPGLQLLGAVVEECRDQLAASASRAVKFSQ